MEIKESNTLIAEFMQSQHDWHWLETPEGVVYNPDDDTNFKFTKSDIEKFKYHSSYDWLMPAVIKARKELEKRDYSSEDDDVMESLDEFSVCLGYIYGVDDSTLSELYENLIEYINAWCIWNRIACEGYPQSEALYGSITEYYKQQK